MIRKLDMDHELKETQQNMIIKFFFLITTLVMLILFCTVRSMAADNIHAPLGYYSPPTSCIQCHTTLHEFDLIYTHNRNCYTCHNTNFSLRFCSPSVYPPDFDFTTICSNYQTKNIWEPFSCGDCHVSAGNHTAAHDQTRFPSTDCSQCHNADAPTEHVKYNFSCSTCHNNIYADVKNAIARGKSGNPVYCADCHGLVDHLVHENAYLPNVECTGCHLTDLGLRADIVNEHAKKNTACSGCHNSSDPVIRAAIDKGIAGNSVLCIDCHRGFGNHALIHDQTVFTSTECSACHLANAVSEHQGHGPHGICCLPCHTNEYPGIISSIYNGMAGQNISCDECHLISGNRPPIANCGADRSAVVGEAITFSGSASFDHYGSIASYQWDFGDGTPNGSGSSVSHTFTAAGSYQVSLTVTDDQGALDTDTCMITVTTVTQPVCGCDLVPDTTTVHRGGTFGFQATVTNNTDSVQVFKFATRIIRPNGRKYPATGYLKGPLTVNLGPHGSISRHLSQYIPNTAPLGIYTYRGYIGVPGNIYDECQFQFTVTQ